ncbi:MAG: MarR family transcriptional regulator [Roseiflexaceae bacterium]
MNQPEQQVQPIDVVQALGRLIPAYQHWSSANIPTDGLSPARMRVLRFLRESGPVSMRAVKDWCGTSATNITGLIDGLEAEGLVQRQADPHDRRVTLLTITAEGDRRSHSDWERYEARSATVFEQLEPSQRAVLLESIEQLIKLLKSA